MKKYIFLSINLLILVVPFFQLQSQTFIQVQPKTLSPILNIATLTNIATPTNDVTTSDQLLIPQIDLRPGVRHQEVKTLQKLLKEVGYLPENLRLTENFGPKTKEAIIKFQKSQGLPATGAFDQETRLAFENYFSQRLMLKRGKGSTVDSSKVNEFFSNLTSRLDRNVSTTCMKLAIEKREDAIFLGWENYVSKIKSAYEIRKNELIEAWGITDVVQRQIAIKNSWNKYRENVKFAQNEWRQLKQNVWSQFNKEVKNCKLSIVEPQEIEEVKETE